MTQPNWIVELFKSIDEMDTKRFLGFLANDSRFRFGNQPVVEGQAAVGAAVDGFFGTIKGVSHHLLRSWSDSDSAIVEGEVTYTRHDDTEVTLPFANIFGIQDEKISDYTIYIDITPLYAQD